MRAVFLLLAVASCGSDGSSDDAHVQIRVDAAWLLRDASCATCNPIDQLGCDEGEKCAPGYVGGQCNWWCTPDGDVPTGGACLLGPGNPFVVDDCLAGDACIDGRCEQLCTLAPDSCADELACMPAEFSFESNIGTCEPPCDVLAQDCTTWDGLEFGMGCYLRVQSGTTRCSAPISPGADAAPGVQGDGCEWDRHCSVGHGCILPDPVDSSSTTCARFCDADGTGGPACDDPFTCVAINGGFYGDATSVPMNIGFCVDCVVWADVPGCM